MQVPPKKRILLKLQGVFIDIVCSVNPTYLDDIVYKSSKKGRAVKDHLPLSWVRPKQNQSQESRHCHKSYILYIGAFWGSHCFL